MRQSHYCYLYPALAVVILLLLATCSGCATKPKQEPPGPPVAIRVPCDEGQELNVPTGLNSNQLEQLLYAAYQEARALLVACNKQRE